MFGFFSKTKNITEKLYEQNLELAVKNKTLSLLEKLYQTSVLTLMPEEMAKAITDTICKDLNLEFAGILVLDSKTDTLLPLAFSESSRLEKSLASQGIRFSNINIAGASKHDFFMEVVAGRKEASTHALEQVFGGFVASNKSEVIATDSHVKTVLAYPLMSGSEV